jgi:tol-pal system protein YbgF
MGPRMRSLAIMVLLGALLSACATTPEEDPVQIKLKDLDARQAHIAASQVDLSQRLDEEQASERELRGRIEQLEHDNDALAKQQRDLYGDLNKRLAAGGAGAAVGGAAGLAASDDGNNGSAASTAGSGNAATNAASGGGAAPSSVEQAVYNQAFDALKAGSYSIAITGFKDFMAHYPASPLAENAQYWLGEAYYVNHDYDPASNAFRTVLKKWPNSRKAPDALLKLGFTQFAQGQYPAARATLTDVTRRFPGTDAAKLASERLRKIPAQTAN